MQPSVKFKNLIGYTTLAASTVKEIAQTVPFLGSTSAVTLSIVNCVDDGEGQAGVQATGQCCKMKECSNELSHAQETFAVQVAGSTLSRIMQMKKDLKQQHEKVVALLLSRDVE
ncbi:hypothetical protein B0H13DRAFT_1899615 [Mycena leptocephala]|nr:hypothetical protein B0H13DRAFT_1899615 [Mycena leptocephala]